MLLFEKQSIEKEKEQMVKDLYEAERRLSGVAVDIKNMDIEMNILECENEDIKDQFYEYKEEAQRRNEEIEELVNELDKKDDEIEYL